MPPDAGDAALVHRKYIGELIPGQYLAETRREVQAVIGRLAEAGAEGVLLAGTELPLLLRDVPDAGVPLLDTNLIHARRAVAELLS